MKGALMVVFTARKQELRAVSSMVADGAEGAQ